MEPNREANKKYQIGSALFDIIAIAQASILLAAFLWAGAERYSMKLPFSIALGRALLLFPVGIFGLLWFVLIQFYPSHVPALQGFEKDPHVSFLAFGQVAIAIAGIIAYFRKEYFYASAVTLVACIYLGGLGLFHLVDFLYVGLWAPGHTGLSVSCNLLTVAALIGALAAWKRKLNHHEERSRP